MSNQLNPYAQAGWSNTSGAAPRVGWASGTLGGPPPSILGALPTFPSPIVPTPPAQFWFASETRRSVFNSLLTGPLQRENNGQPVFHIATSYGPTRIPSITEIKNLPSQGESKVLARIEWQSQMVELRIPGLDSGFTQTPISHFLTPPTTSSDGVETRTTSVGGVVYGWTKRPGDGAIRLSTVILRDPLGYNSSPSPSQHLGAIYMDRDGVYHLDLDPSVLRGMLHIAVLVAVLSVRQ